MRMRHNIVLLLGMCAGVALVNGVAAAAERVAIFFDVPDGLQKYSGGQPVTFGVPFERGALRKSHGLRVIDSAGRSLPAQFEVTATWAPGSDEVRWLLVDLLVELENGQAPEAFLEFGPDVPKPDTDTRLEAQVNDGRAIVNSGKRTFTLCRETGVLGQFLLTDGDGKVYRAGGEGGQFEIPGPVRAVVKVTGDYVAEDGSSIAKFVTRARFYADCPFVRVYHTLIWLTDASVKIGGLSFRADSAMKPFIAASEEECFDPTHLPVHGSESFSRAVRCVNVAGANGHGAYGLSPSCRSAWLASGMPAAAASASRSLAVDVLRFTPWPFKYMSPRL